MPFVEVDTDTIIKEECKDPEFKKHYDKIKERYSKPNSKKKRWNSMDRARKLKRK